LRMHREAQDEVRDAIAYYAGVRDELAKEFTSAVRDAVTAIKEHAMMNSVPVPIKTSRRIRRRFLKGFPYAVVFEIREDELLVVAVAHFRRRHGYWRKRT